MSYFLQNSELEHRSCLESTVKGWINGPQDVFLVSQEGEKIHSQQAFFILHSSMLARLFDEAKDACPGVSVDVSSATVTTLIDLLANGQTICDKKVNLKDVECAAALLGINITDTVIGRLPEAKKDAWPVSVKRMGNKSEAPIKKFRVNLHSNINNTETNQANVDGYDNKDKKTAKFNSITVTRSLFSIVKEENTRVDEKVIPGSPTTVGVVCGVCSCRFKHKKGLERHLKRDNCKGRAENPNKAFNCDKCEKGFNLQSSLYNHKIIHMDVMPYKCGECGKTFSQAGNLKIHSKSQHGIELYDIKKCRDYVQNDSKEGQADCMNKEDDISVGELDQSENMDNLIKVEPLEYSIKTETLNILTNNVIICDACHTKFNSTKGLKQHLKYNNCKGYVTPKLFKCDKCEKSFTFKTSLRRHKVVHTDDLFGDQSYINSEHDKKENENIVKTELLDVPLNDGKSCSDCCQTFKRRKGLRLHLKNNRCKGKADNSKKRFKCKQCGKAFRILSKLKRHEVSHMDELPHKCNECGKSFSYVWNMKKHAKTHWDMDSSVVKKREDLDDNTLLDHKTDILAGEDNKSDNGFVDIEPTENGDKNVTQEDIEEDSFDGINDVAVYPAVSLFCKEFENVVERSIE